ncbi:MAG: hypothetical protein V3V14_04495, partial [Saprospiraceae bacterium]
MKFFFDSFLKNLTSISLIGVFMLMCSMSLFSQGNITHFKVDGTWSGNDANGNAIIKYTIKVCTDGPTTGVKVFAPSNNAETSGTVDALGDGDSPGNSTSGDICCPGNWSPTSGGSLAGPTGNTCGQTLITPAGGLEFTQSGTGCAEISWTTYSKDYESSDDDENHYVVAAACVGCASPASYDCSGMDG